MREIQIKYRKGPCTRIIKLHVPSAYHEMTQQQFVAVAAMGNGLIGEKYFFKRYFGLPESIVVRLDEFQLYQLSEMLNYLKSDKPDGKMLLRDVEGMKAPHDKLAGMSLQQFMTVDTFFSWYNLTKKPNWIDQMACTLFMRKGEDFFTEYPEPDIAYREKLALFEAWDEELKMATLFQWSLIKMWLSKIYPEMFAPGDGTQKEEPSRWLDIFDSFVGDEVADMDKYKRMECMDALRIMNRRIKEARNEKHRRVH